MFSDLNVAVQESRAANLRLLQTLANAGYQRVALCHHVTLKKGVQLRPAPDLSDLLDETPPTRRGRKLEVLQRLNVIVDDPAVLHILSSPAAESYDLLSLCPSSGKVFLQSCSVLPIDIITFNFSGHLPFNLKHTQLLQAVDRGVSLEICYSPALQGSSTRRSILTNAQDLVKACKGKGVLVSSGASRPLEIRPPLDIVNLSRLFGLSDLQCKAGITTISRTAILHADMRRHSAKAVVSCYPLSDRQKRSERESGEGEPMTKKPRLS